MSRLRRSQKVQYLERHSLDILNVKVMPFQNKCSAVNLFWVTGEIAAPRAFVLRAWGLTSAALEIARGNKTLTETRGEVSKRGGSHLEALTANISRTYGDHKGKGTNISICKGICALTPVISICFEDVCCKCLVLGFCQHLECHNLHI
jgi:hypothetical protein